MLRKNMLRVRPIETASKAGLSCSYGMSHIMAVSSSRMGTDSVQLSCSTSGGRSIVIWIKEDLVIVCAIKVGYKWRSLSGVQ